MIETSQGDILKADAEALVNTVNCVGVMGRGIALQFKNKFPENFAAYKKACDEHELTLGKVLVFDLEQMFNPRYIINFPTKDHWRSKSQLEDIESGLIDLKKEVLHLGIKSIAIPPLGCGLGGLNWNVVRPKIVAAFSDMNDVRVLLFAPKGAPAVEKMTKSSTAPRMTSGRAAMIGLMNQYLSAVMDPFVSLLEIHKMMYFMQELNEPLKLRFQKGLYGPYAENLRHVLIATEGYFTSGYGDGEDDPTKSIEVLGNSVDKANNMLDKLPDTKARFEKVADLISGFETPYGMELLATVHWVSKHEGAGSSAEAVEKVHSWNPRKQIFSKEHIDLAWRVLESKGLTKTS